MTFSRVHIFGGAGSGKTTLAETFSQAYGIPHYELDDVYYLEPSARSRRDKSERDARYGRIVSNDAWVIDGIFWQPWVTPSLERADKIIVLAIPQAKRHYRVCVRHLKLLSKASLSEYPRFFPTLVELLKHNRIYDSGPLQETLELVSGYGDKVSICQSNSEAAALLEI